MWLFYENSVTLIPRSPPRAVDGADKNFRPISTIMPNMNEIHQRIFKIWGLINFNAKTLTLWRKDERTNERTYVRTNERTNRRTEKRKLYTPTYFVCRGIIMSKGCPMRSLSPVSLRLFFFFLYIINGRRSHSGCQYPNTFIISACSKSSIGLAVFEKLFKVFVFILFYLYLGINVNFADFIDV